jgi:hypothetical protein
MASVSYLASEPSYLPVCGGRVNILTPVREEVLIVGRDVQDARASDAVEYVKVVNISVHGCRECLEVA